MLSKKQKLQKDRAYFKFVISGLYKPVKEDSLTIYERVLWKQILDIKDRLIKDFDISSHMMGLKVPQFRCWCGKEGKYDPEDNYYEGKVCKKHIKRC